MTPVEDPLPTYQYACTECGHAFEQFQSFTDDALTVCPECEGRLRKVFNAVGVGFYRTDSRTDGKSSTTASSSTSDSSSGEKKSETKTETKSTPTKSDSTSAA